MGTALFNHSEWGGAGFRPLSPLGGGETPRTFCFSVEGSSPWWTELVRKGALCRHGNHDDYACFSERTPTLGLEGLESCV
jgi:hypothetical protein